MRTGTAVAPAVPVGSVCRNDRNEWTCGTNYRLPLSRWLGPECRNQGGTDAVSADLDGPGVARGNGPGFRRRPEPARRERPARTPAEPEEGVEYETPAEAAAIDACKVETVYNAQKRPIGVALRDGQGKLLRKFIDSNGNGVMDQWSYLPGRVRGLSRDRPERRQEPRRMPLDELRRNADRRRSPGDKITGWKRISAEEASKVFVQALVAADLPLLETVIATPEELDKLGIPKGEIEQVAAAAKKRAEQVNALIKGLVGWNSQTVWNRLDGMMPHLIPADARLGAVAGPGALRERRDLRRARPTARAARASWRSSRPPR